MAIFERIVIASNRAGENPGLERAAQQFHALQGPGNIRTVHVAGAHSGRETLDSVLTAASSHGADLLIAGGRSHVFASRAAMLSPCSVLMVPDGSAVQMNRILVPVDFSHHSQHALRTGAGLAAQSGGEALCLFIESEDAPWHLQPDVHAEHAHKLASLQEFAHGTVGSRPSLRCIAEPVEHSSAILKRVRAFSLPHAIEGADVAATIVHVAEREESGLIVIGTRGRSRSAAVLLGSVTEKVIQFAHCPVLAVRIHGANLGLLDVLLGHAKAPAVA
ncbi:MAG: universal stress protein [Bryobacteraceae bacterium]|nr:universal stress protein [Bryobacteraceae bacterium]